MKQILVSTFLFISLILLVITTHAQERILHGTVTALDTFPLVGAEVKVLSSKQIVQTDSLGRFAVGINATDKIKISGDGFYPQKLKIPEKVKVLYVDLKMKSGEKNQKAAFEYARQEDVDRLSSVALINNESLDFSKYTNIYELIRGRLPGVTVAGSEIIVRGVGSLNGSNAALIVIDGLPSSSSVLNTISPANVKDIQVLKGGDAAIYGVRGANGVVLIKTKTGGDI